MCIEGRVESSHSPEYHRFVTEPPCCDGFTEEEMANLLRSAGLRPEVDVVNCVHYLECRDQEKAKREYEKQAPCRGSIVDMESSSLPSLLQIASTVYEKDVFPFVVGCGYSFCVSSETSIEKCVMNKSQSHKNSIKWLVGHVVLGGFVKIEGFHITETQSCQFHALKKVINSFLQQRAATPNARKG